MSARRRRPYRQRAVKTIMPSDSIFRFSACARAEGRGGLRVTVPRPVVRGLHHLGWAGFRLRLRIAGGESFTVRARHPSGEQTVVALPLEHRGALAAGDFVELEATLPR